MRRIVLILLATMPLVNSYGQVTYESTADSFRKHFALLLEDDGKITLFGWELDQHNDTLTYRAVGHLGPESEMTFNKFEFSGTPPSKVQWPEFHKDNNVSIPIHLLHRHMGIISRDK